MRRFAVALVGALSGLVSSEVLGQAASGTWPLTSVSTITATSSGNVLAQNESFGSMVINNYSGPGSSQRVTTTDGNWPAEAQQNESRYVQFAVSPNAGYEFNVTSVTLSLGASGGGNMRANIWYSTDPTFATRTQLNSGTIVLPNGAFVSPSPSYSISVLVNDGQTFYVRIYPWYTTSSSGKYLCPQNVVISGMASTPGAAMTPSVDSLAGFFHAVGLPSATQPYTLSGSGLTANVVVTPPAGFEISSDGGGTWSTSSSPLNLAVAGGIIVGQPVAITVRLNAPSGGPFSGNIVHTSTGVTAAIVNVNGFALAAEPTTQCGITFGTVTGNSIVVNFSGGNGSNRILVARAGSAVSFLPTDGSPVSGVSSNFVSAADQGNGNKVVYDGTGSGVTITGLAQNTTYHVAVYEYNVGAGNSQNYNTTLPGTGNQTTLVVPTINAAPSSLSFGGVVVNTTSPEATYSLSAGTLTPSSGNIVVSAPTGFEVSTTSGSGFAASINVPYSGGALSPTTIHVRFLPTALTGYSGNITNAGGGATTENVAVSGTGVGPTQPNVLEAENGILSSAYIGSQYSGYSGTGYVDIANKTGASLEVTFRRASAATDTVIAYYALGASTRAYSVSVNDVVIGSLSFTGTGSWTAWSSVVMMVPMQAGVNRLKFSATTNNSENANLDRVYVGGQTATPVFQLLLSQSGSGSVVASPPSPDTYYDAGTPLTLTATPSGGSMFYRWSGSDPATVNPHSITMNAHKTAIAILPASPGFGPFPYEAAPKGFAAVGAFTYPSGTTGGTGPGAHVAYVTNSDDLGNLMLRRTDVNHTLNFPPLTVYVIGTLTPGAVVTDMCDVKDAYDISIIGVGVDATISGFGLNIVRSKNIIVRNLKIQNAPDDGITVQADDIDGTGNHLWFDHNTITNCYDGALDVTHTASYVTVSWNHFHHHDKLCLMGHSDTQSSDVTMKVSYHHNFFDSTGQRHPRVRYGKAHVYNNYYRKVSLYGVSSNQEADVVVEGNYFLNVPLPTDTSRDGSVPGDVVSVNNIFDNSGPGQTRGTAFDPSIYYGYSIDDPATIPALLSSYAGSGKWDFSSEGGAPPSPPGVPLLVAPPNGSIGLPIVQSLVWRTNLNTTGYRVQLGLDSTFGSQVEIDSSLTDTSCIVAGLNPSTAYFWRVQALNAIGAGGFSQPWKFQTTAASVAHISPMSLNFGNVQVDSSAHAIVKVYSTGSADLHVDSIRVSSGEFAAIPTVPAIVPAGDSLLVTVTFSPTTAGNQDGYLLVYSDAASSPDSVGVTGTGSSSNVSVGVPISAGWNLVSNPVTNPIPGDSVRQLFPTSVNAYAFEFSGGYVQRFRMENGKGYWGKFSSDTMNTITGIPRTLDSIDVGTGWNLIGSVSAMVDTSAIVSIPAGLRSSSWFGYAAGYSPVTQLAPGMAYWVKSNGVGKFVLTSLQLTRAVREGRRDSK